MTRVVDWELGQSWDYRTKYMIVLDKRSMRAHKRSSAQNVRRNDLRLLSGSILQQHTAHLDSRRSAKTSWLH